jgi:hypothetical protein
MRTTDDPRTFGLQLPLPLAEVVPAPAPVAVPDLDPEAVDAAGPGDGDAPWRIDEHTRQVGRRGIAEARARLRSRAGRAA